MHRHNARMTVCAHLEEIRPVEPSGNGCVECLELGMQWVHLRRCTSCGHIGCCDNSPGRHATGHFHGEAHAIIQSFEPGEDWFWDYAAEEEVEPADLVPPLAHPLDQPTPGPVGRVPADWEERLH